MKKTYTWLPILFLILQSLCHTAHGCTIAVVSAKASSTGRPFLWKNRDYSLSPREEINYSPGGKRIGSLRIVGETYLYSNINLVSGGVNDDGFAIVNDSVREESERELFNVNHLLLQRALETCKSLTDFETFLNRWNNRLIFTICGDFAVIDAYGGAALYEVWSDGPGNPLMWKKYDASTSENGYVIRANSHQTEGWGVHPVGGNAIRYQRARDLFQELFENGDISPRTVLQRVSKDVGGDCDKHNPDEACLKYGYGAVDLGNFDTSSTLSRNTATSAYVIDGANDERGVPLITLYCALGEPAFTPVVPYFLYSRKVSWYARAEKLNLWGCAVDMETGSFLGRAAEKILLDGLYDDNRKTSEFDTTIHYEALIATQAWIFPIEDFIFDKTERYLDSLRKHPEWITPESLYDFSHECARYTFENTR